jgi:hypothetical protein
VIHTSFQADLANCPRILQEITTVFSHEECPKMRRLKIVLYLMLGITPLLILLIHVSTASSASPQTSSSSSSVTNGKSNAWTANGIVTSGTQLV